MSAQRSTGRDLPLMAWGDELRGRRIARRKLRLRMAIVVVFSLTVMSPVLLAPLPRLLWNASASAPVGLYWIAPARILARGDLVSARLAPDMARLASDRRYLAFGLPVVKHVAGLPGDRICGKADSVSINGKIVAWRVDVDGGGRRLPSWRGCTTLSTDQVLLLNADVRDSFDGRYFGPTRRLDILGRAHPLWLR